MKLKQSLHECNCGCKKCQTPQKNEGAHYKTKLKKIIENSYLIHQIITDFDELPAWIQDKITIADHNMGAIIDYLETEMEMNYSWEEVQQNPKFIEMADMNLDGMLEEAEYRGRNVNLGKPFRTSGGPKKFSVYVKNKSGNIVKVNFGDPNMRIKNADPKRAKSFRARHKCDQKKDRTTPGYWSCNVGRYKDALGLTSSRNW
jgi:uncharacterized protein (DUF2249 family)